MASSFTPQQIEEFLQEFFDVVGARQYVGARYIPIFGRAGEDTTEWDDLAPYEPLTIVMHDGNSYVSRQYVPTGIDIADTHYWAEMANYNGQIEAYRQETARVAAALDVTAETVEELVTALPLSAFEDLTVEQSMTGLGNELRSLINDSIAALSSATPVFVASTADMTDSSKVYVLTSNRHIYYYNGTQFIDSGAVYASDTNALNTYAKITDSNYATVLPSLNNASANSAYILNLSNNSGLPTEVPDGYRCSGSDLLITMQYDTFTRSQILFARVDKKVWHRSLSGSSQLQAWSVIASRDYDPSLVHHGFSSIVDDNNYSTMLPTLAGAAPNSSYVINITEGTSSCPTDSPTGNTWNNGAAALLLTFGTSSLKKQVFFNSSNIYRRFVNNGTASDWVGYIQSINTITQGATIWSGTTFNKLSESPQNTYCSINIEQGSTKFTDLPYPDSKWAGGGAAILVNITISNLWQQFLITNDITFKRTLSSSDGSTMIDWRAIRVRPEFEITVSKANQSPNNVTTFNSLVKGCRWAFNLSSQFHVTVRVYDGTYDLVSELEEDSGVSISQFSGSMSYQFKAGIILGNYDVIGQGNVNVTLDNTAGVEYVEAEMSAFTTIPIATTLGLTYNNFLVEGLKITTKRTRYAIHDELGGSTTPVRKWEVHEYRNNEFVHDNTGNTRSANAVLGCGLGRNTRLIFHDNYVENNSIVNNDPSNVDFNCIFVHNNINAGARGFVDIRGNYLTRGKVIIAYYGASTLVTRALIHGNSYLVAPQLRQETQDYSNVNMEMIVYNNELRQA